MTYKKVGGLHFFRFGRFGASFYIARPAPRRSRPEAESLARDCRVSGRLELAAIVAGALMAAALPVLLLAM